MGPALALRPATGDVSQCAGLEVDARLTGRCEDDGSAWDRFALVRSSLGHSSGGVLDAQEDTALSATGQMSDRADVPKDSLHFPSHVGRWPD
jgi:hypothetical protein